MTVHITICIFYFFSVLLFLCSEAHVSQLSTAQESSSTTGFGIDLIHREFSPESPFYNPLATHCDRLKNVIGRSQSRVSHVQSNTSSGTIQTTILGVTGEYLMKFLIGTPPVEITATADTGSDLIWIKCKPCKKCSKHESPLFDLRGSSSYKSLKCGSKQCKAIRNYTTKCTRKHNKCQYHVHYLDKSFSNGHLATETFSFGKTSVKKVAFGCGHNNGGFDTEEPSGVVGLGRGPLAIMSQLDGSIRGKFSYCLVPPGENATSTIFFGEKAQTNESGVVLTPLFRGPEGVYYYLNLEKVIVGKKSFKLNPLVGTGEKTHHGNIIIDTGTTVTYLPKGDFYDGIVFALKEAIGVEPIEDPEGRAKLCYKTSSNIKVPLIAFQFTGATLEIPPEITYWELGEDLSCFALMPADGLAIFGSFFQANLLVSYDLVKKKVSFKPTDCSKF